MILSGSTGGSPRLISSTNSMPFTTRPNKVYSPSRKIESSKQMKNWLLALSGFWERAMPTAPRVKDSLSLNSAGTSGSFEPPMPVPVGSPVCAMKRSMTR